MTIPRNVTAPRTADTLGELVALVEQFSIGGEWTVTVLPTSRYRATLRWAELAITVRAASDLALARYIALERQRARRQLREDVVRVATSLGLPRGPFLRPATPAGR